MEDISLPSRENIPESSSSDSYDKDVEIQSLHSHSYGDDGHAVGDAREAVTRPRKVDIEACPDGVDVLQSNKWNISGGHGILAGNVKEGAVTRTSTKSSWKDPGPPPDGGWVGWTQGLFSWTTQASLPLPHTSLEAVTDNVTP